MAGITVARRGVTTGHGSGDLPQSVVSVSSGTPVAGQVAQFTGVGNHVVPAASSGSAINVKASPYGAKGDGATDDTAAIQAAIDAATNAGGGTIFFPAGSYLVAGALQTSPSIGSGLGLPYNSQLTLPAIATSAAKIPLTFLGPEPMAQTEVWGSGGSRTSPGNAAFIVSNSAGTPFATHGTVPSVLGGPDISSGSFTNVIPIVQNLGVVTPINPQIAALNFVKCSSAKVNDTYISTQDYINGFTTAPSHPVGIGLWMPGDANNDNCTAQNVFIEGYYAGFVAGEHTDATQIVLQFCIIGISWATMHHSFRLGYVDCARCTYTLGFNGYGSLAAGSPANSVAAWFDIDLLDIEEQVGGSPSWANLIDHLYDPTNALQGTVRYIHVQTGLGAQATPWTTNGGAGVNATNLVLPLFTIVPSTQQAAGYTMALTDCGKRLQSTGGGAQTFTFPSGVFPIGTTGWICQRGAGQVTIAGPTILSPGGLVRTRVQNSTVTWTCVDVNTFLLAGDLV